MVALPVVLTVCATGSAYSTKALQSHCVDINMLCLEGFEGMSLWLISEYAADLYPVVVRLVPLGQN